MDKKPTQIGDNSHLTKQFYKSYLLNEMGGYSPWGEAWLRGQQGRYEIGVLMKVPVYLNIKISMLYMKNYTYYF